MGTVRLVPADDAVLIRDGLARLLAEAGFDVMAQVGDATSLLALVAEHQPDVAVVDIRMPPTGLSGTSVTTCPGSGITIATTVNQARGFEAASNRLHAHLLRLALRALPSRQ
jgi:DNA-binding NarL/FixJ family response regulator